MQSFIKRYFFVVNLLFICASAYLLARATNIIAGHYLRPDPAAVQAPVSAKPKTDKAPGRDFSNATDRNIFGAKREQLVESEIEEPEDQAPKLDPDAEAVPTTLNLKLVNTTVFIPAEWSLATIQDLSSKSSKLYSVNACDPAEVTATAAEGESAEASSSVVKVRSVKIPSPCNRLLDTATIIAIEVSRVVFLNEQSGQKEYLDFNADPKARPRVASARPQSAGRGKGGPTGKGIRKVSANSFEIEQAEIDATLSNLNTIATQARIVPSFKNGKANGFKLFSIRPGSLYSKIGIRNGDVIQRINGYEITSPDKALEIYSKLKDAKQITVDLQRRGKAQTLDYSIVP